MLTRRCSRGSTSAEGAVSFYPVLPESHTNAQSDIHRVERVASDVAAELPTMGERRP